MEKEVIVSGSAETSLSNSKNTSKKIARPVGMMAFTIIWLGQILSVMGTRMTNFALSVWAWQETKQASTFALITFFSLVSTVVFSPMAGALVDRWSRRLVVILSDLGSTVTTTVMLFLFLTGQVQIWELCVVNCLTGAFLAFQFPAYSSMISAMLTKEQYTRANGMLSLTRSSSNIVAPALASILLLILGMNGILWIDIATYCIAIGTVFLVALPQKAITENEKTRKKNIWRESVYGFQYLLKNRNLLYLELLFFGITFSSAIGWILLRPMILARTNNNEVLLGTILSIGAIGGVLGGIVISSLKSPQRKIYRILGSMILYSICGRFLLGLGNNAFIWSIAWFSSWFFLPFIDGYNQSLWQEKIPAAVQGRVFAAKQVIENIAQPVATLLAGPLADYLFEPALRPGGSLAPLFGWIVGTTAGSGMALITLFTGIFGVIIGICGFVLPAIRNIETLLPDAS